MKEELKNIRDEFEKELPLYLGKDEKLHKALRAHFARLDNLINTNSSSATNLEHNILKSKHDSTTDTLKHIKRVNQLLIEASIELLRRATIHDNSKLDEPEKSAFDVLTPKLAGLTYNSSEYKESLAQLKPALDHHYKHNPHHPEHFEDGVEGMDLFDIIEMFFDWKAATERHNNGNIYTSIGANTTRFKLHPQLARIFSNTATNLKWK